MDLYCNFQFDRWRWGLGSQKPTEGLPRYLLYVNTRLQTGSHLVSGHCGHLHFLRTDGLPDICYLHRAVQYDCIRKTRTQGEGEGSPHYKNTSLPTLKQLYIFLMFLDILYAVYWLNTRKLNVVTSIFFMWLFKVKYLSKIKNLDFVFCKKLKSINSAIIFCPFL